MDVGKGFPMNVRYYVYLGRRWALVAVLPAILVAGVAYLILHGQAKTYKATTTLYVQQIAGGTISVPLSIQAAQEYAAMISAPIIEPDTQRLMATKYHYPGYYLDPKNLTITTPRLANAPLVFVTVADRSPYRATAASSAAAQALIQRVQRVELVAFKAAVDSLQRQFATVRTNIKQLTQQVNAYQGSPVGLATITAQLQANQTRLQQLQSYSEQVRTQEDSLLNTVTVYQAASVPNQPASNHELLIALLAGLAALALLSGGMYGYSYLRNKPETVEAVESAVEAPVLGAVPRFNPKKLGTQLVTEKLPHSEMAEAYRLIRTNVQFPASGKPARTIVVTSPSLNDGKSTTASNLARAFADSGSTVALIDGDMRRPSLQSIFGSEEEKGLSNLLVDQTPNGPLITPNGNGKLHLIGAGPRFAPTLGSPADLLASERMRAILSELRGEASVVILDTPPVLAASDAVVLSAMVDGVVLVIDPHRSSLVDLRRSREAIEAVGGKILGVVLNGVTTHDRYYSPQPYLYR